MRQRTVGSIPPFPPNKKAGPDGACFLYTGMPDWHTLESVQSLLLAMEKVRRIAPLAKTNRIADGSDAGADAVFALFRHFIDTRFVVIQEVLRTEFRNGDDRHETLAPAFKPSSRPKGWRA